MYLELLDSLTLSGDPAKPNDDAFAHDGGTPEGQISSVYIITH